MTWLHVVVVLDHITNTLRPPQASGLAHTTRSNGCDSIVSSLERALVATECVRLVSTGHRRDTPALQA